MQDVEGFIRTFHCSGWDTGTFCSQIIYIFERMSLWDGFADGAEYQGPLSAATNDWDRTDRAVQ